MGYNKRRNREVSLRNAMENGAKKKIGYVIRERARASRNKKEKREKGILGRMGVYCIEHCRLSIGMGNS